MNDICPVCYWENEPIEYPNDKNHLVIDEEAAEVVRLIFDLALSNIGVVKITRELNKRGIMPPSIYKASKGDLSIIGHLW